MDTKQILTTRKSMDYFAVVTSTYAHAYKLHDTSMEETPLVYPLTTLSTPYCTRRQTSSRLPLHAFAIYILSTHTTDAPPMSQRYKTTY